MTLDQEVRELFPQLGLKIRNRRLVYLDSAATTLKSLSVIETMREHMTYGTANVHRGAHFLSDEATGRFEEARELASQFVGAEQSSEIIFNRGTTDGINLVARSLGSLVLSEGDEIILSQMEHHSNIVPWQMIAQEKRVRVRFVPVLEDGALDFEAFQRMLSPKVKIVSLVHLSNALGTLNPVEKFFRAAHDVGAVCILDAAQSASVMPLKVKSLGCDFLALSGHKIFGPTGVGILYGKKSWLERMPPYQGGGSMISSVSEEGSDYLPPPHRFEAGTPAIAEVLGLASAFKFLTGLGFARIREHEIEIMKLAEAELEKLGGFRRIGVARERAHILSFVLEGSHPSDIGAILDEQGIAIRAGHHCCQPLMKRFGVPGTARASFSIYTSEQDVRELIAGLKKAKEMLL